MRTWSFVLLWSMVFIFPLWAEEDSAYREGLYLLQQEQFVPALERLNESVRLRPRAENYFALGVSHFRLFHYQQAHQAYLSALRFIPDEPLVARIRSGLGDIFLQLEDYPAAIDLYQRALSYDGSWAGVRLRLATAYLRQSRYEDALALTEGLQHYSASSHEAEFLRSLVYLARQEWTKATSQLTQLLDVPQYRFQAAQQLNWLYRIQGQSAPAMEMAQLLLKEYALQGPQAYQIAAMTWLERIQECKQRLACDSTPLIADARNFFQRWLLLAPQQAQAYWGLGQLEQSLGQWQAAYESYQSASRLFPDQSAYLWRFATSARALSEREAVRETLEKLMLIDPLNWSEWIRWKRDQPLIFERWLAQRLENSSQQRGLRLFWLSYAAWQEKLDWNQEQEHAWQEAATLLKKGPEYQVIQALKLWHAGKRDWALRLLVQMRNREQGSDFLSYDVLARLQMSERGTGPWLELAYRQYPHSVSLARGLIQQDYQNSEILQGILRVFPENADFQRLYLEQLRLK